MRLGERRDAGLGGYVLLQLAKEEDLDRRGRASAASPARKAAPPATPRYIARRARLASGKGVSACIEGKARVLIISKRKTPPRAPKKPPIGARPRLARSPNPQPRARPAAIPIPAPITA